jgi:hypothetical protein
MVVKKRAAMEAKPDVWLTIVRKARGSDCRHLTFRHGRARPGHPRLSRLRAVKTWRPGTPDQQRTTPQNAARCVASGERSYLRVPDAAQRSSRCSAEPGPIRTWINGPRISSAPRRKARRAAQHPGNAATFVSRTRRSALRAAPQSRDPFGPGSMDPGSAAHHAAKRGALRRVRDTQLIDFVTAPSGERYPSRSAAAAAVRPPAARTPAALPGPGREIVARCRRVACRPYRMRARPRHRRFG